jgi:hypothetical protein
MFMKGFISSIRAPIGCLTSRGVIEIENSGTDSGIDSGADPLNHLLKTSTEPSLERVSQPSQ